MRRQRVAAIVVVGLVGAVCAYVLRPDGGVTATRPVGEGSRTPDAAATAWPHPSATLQPPAVQFPTAFGQKRVFVDAGHGAGGNTGNVSAFCVDEQDFTMGLASWLARWLAETGHFEVLLSRQPGETVEYRERVERANEWKAAAFISLHSDVRGQSEPWSPDAGLSCPRTGEGPGFSVLWSDDPPAPLSVARLTLARATAAQLRRAGFPAYDGQEYRNQYQADAQSPGVFVDRHLREQRIFVLRTPRMPSIIIETHNAWHPQEARRWREEATREAFAAAVAAALVDVLR